MKLPFWEQAKPSGAILGSALDSVFEELCDRKQVVLLATPYLSFESRFLERCGQELRIRATMSRDAVKHTLGQQPVRLRFPWALTFYSGLTRVLGYEQEEHRRTLRIEVPDHLVLDEQRWAFRVDRVGHSTGAIGSPDGTILKITLDNLSPLGAGAFCMEAIPMEKFQSGRALDLSLSLDQGFTLLGQAKICHSSGQNLGLAFQPPLPLSSLHRLAEWLAPREEEAKRRWVNRAELRAKAERALQPKSAPKGVLLLSNNAELAAGANAALEDVQPLRAVALAMAPFREAMAEPPLLILIDASALDMEGRYRLRTLLETVPVNIPTLVLGSAEFPDAGRLLAAELKATAHFNWNPNQGFLFQKLVQGLIKNHGMGAT